MNEPAAELPFISILVMSHNQEAYIGACLDSVLSQQYAGKLEIVVCDDCSTDDSYRIICEKAAAYKGPHRVITHRCPVNGRVAVNMNTAVALSHGDWLMRVDGDDILHPDRTRLAALTILRYPEATAVSGERSIFRDVPEPVVNPPDDALRFAVGDRREWTAHRKSPGIEWWGCAMTLSRHIFTKFGELPSQCYVLDDTMFATRALMLGQFVIVKNAVVLYYRRHAGNISSHRNEFRLSFAEIRRQDRASRDYYKRGIPCHKPILDELEAYTTEHPDTRGLLDYFRARFTELRRQALYWEKPLRERVADAHISGGILRRLPHTFTALCPFTYALVRYLKQFLR